MNQTDDMISFIIRDGSNNSHVFSMSAHRTIGDLKKQLQEKKQGNHRIILTYSGTTLKENKTLEECGIVNDSCLDYTLNLDGGCSKYKIVN